MNRVSGLLPGLHWLENRKITIDGVSFVGATLWFEESEAAKTNRFLMNDFRMIDHFEPYVYHKSDESARFIENNTTSNDIVITHHLPSNKSVHSIYKNSALNVYFVRDMEEVIIRNQPKIWIHGHTHIPTDYNIGNTRIICNPLGYANTDDQNAHFNDNLVLEV